MALAQSGDSRGFSEVSRTSIMLDSGFRRNDDACPGPRSRVYCHAGLDKPAPYLIRGHPETTKRGRFLLLNWLKTSQSLSSNYTSRTLFLVSSAYSAVKYCLSVEASKIV